MINFEKTGELKIFGLHPEFDVSALNPEGEGSIKDDYYRMINGGKLDVSFSFSMTQSQYMTAISKVDNLLRGNVTYNINTNNCTTWAVNFARDLGFSLPKNVGFGHWLLGSGLNPADLGEDLIIIGGKRE